MILLLLRFSDGACNWKQFDEESAAIAYVESMLRSERDVPLHHRFVVDYVIFDVAPDDVIKRM